MKKYFLKLREDYNMRTTERLQMVGCSSQFAVYNTDIVYSYPSSNFTSILTIGNITNVLSRASFMGIMAIGLMFPIFNRWYGSR